MNSQTNNLFRILWIEDQILELQAGVDELGRLVEERLGRKVEVIEAQWMEKAEEEIDRHRNTPPDLIVLDVMLPRSLEDFNKKPRTIDLNAGFAIWSRLRLQKLWGDGIAAAPILVVTAPARPLFRPIMEKDARLRWLEKPVGPSTIVDEIFVLLSTDGVPQES